jgi:hypothetical protein
MNFSLILSGITRDFKIRLGEKDEKRLERRREKLKKQRAEHRTQQLRDLPMDIDTTSKPSNNKNNSMNITNEGSSNATAEPSRTERRAREWVSIQRAQEKRALWPTRDDHASRIKWRQLKTGISVQPTRMQRLPWKSAARRDVGSRRRSPIAGSFGGGHTLRSRRAATARTLGETPEETMTSSFAPPRIAREARRTGHQGSLADMANKINIAQRYNNTTTTSSTDMGIKRGRPSQQKRRMNVKRYQ